MRGHKLMKLFNNILAFSAMLIAVALTALWIKSHYQWDIIYVRVPQPPGSYDLSGVESETARESDPEPR